MAALAIVTLLTLLVLALCGWGNEYLRRVEAERSTADARDDLFSRKPPKSMQCRECGAFHEKYPGGCPLVKAGARRADWGAS